MTITYETVAPFVKLFETSTSATAKRALGAEVGSRFVGEGVEENDRLKVIFAGETAPEWWIDKDDLRIVDASELEIELPRLVDSELFEDASLAARTVSGFLDGGGMNAEYLLLLAWAESGWTNADSLGRDGQDADLDDELGPFRFSKATWSTMLSRTAYAPILRDYGEADRLRPQAQCFVAACYANRLQRVLKSLPGGQEPAAWLLRLGHRIGEEAVLRFAQLGENDAVSTQVEGVAAVPDSQVNANKKLFPNGAATTRSEVLAAIKAELNSARMAVLERLGPLAQDSVLHSLVNGSAPDSRRGALGLLDFIAKFESGGNYNAVVDRPRNQENPRLVAMSIRDVLAFQRRLGVRNACGKFQIIRSTLDETKDKAGLDDDDLFDANGQDRLALELLMVKRGGKDFLKTAGSTSDIVAFALRVAQEWAAMPVLAPTQGMHTQIVRGDSFYKAGPAGNAAHASADAFEAAIRRFKAEV